MELQIYKNTVAPIDTELLRSDEYCFSVLIRILAGECRLTLTDGERLIICHSADQYPVWVWLADKADADLLERAYSLTKEHFKLGENRFCISYPVAEYFMRRAIEDGITLTVKMNMLAYSCKHPIPPKTEVDGRLLQAGPEDLEDAVELIRRFHEDVGIYAPDDEEYRAKARAWIDAGVFFFWEDCLYRRVSCCCYRIAGDHGSIGAVFTRLDERRLGYGSNLVYGVTRIILERGLTPTLYTDADYRASNACYEGIGFVCEGELCTLG